MTISGKFAAISLEALNAKADMLKRIDNKYIIRKTDLLKASSALAKHFDMLEIDGIRDFTYQTCYFDTPDLECYFDHHQGRRNRVKIRMRYYVDSDLCFVEVKMKGKRSRTIKKRLQQDPACFGQLNAEARAFISQCHQEQYGKPFHEPLIRSLDMQYQRMTLVAKQGGERMTIDGQLQFFADGRIGKMPGNRLIVEAKSVKGNGIADKILRRLYLQPTKRCSKYCTGIAFMHPQIRANRFLPALRGLGGYPRPAAIAA